MYSKEELGFAKEIISRIADMHGLPESQVRLELSKAMEASRNDPSPSAREKWADFKYSDTEPTIEEFILWASSLIKKRL